MTRAFPEPASGHRRVQAATGATAAAATVAAALFGVLFADPERAPAAASPQAASSPLVVPAPRTEPSPAASDPATVDGANPDPAAGPTPARPTHHHRVRRPAPVQPPPQPPARSSGRGNVSSGAS